MAKRKRRAAVKRKGFAPKKAKLRVNRSGNSRSGRKFATKVVKGGVKHVYSIGGKKKVVFVKKTAAQMKALKGKQSAKQKAQPRAANGRWI